MRQLQLVWALVFATDRDRLARFQREAELLTTLTHPNIAALYGSFTAGTQQQQYCPAE